MTRDVQAPVIQKVDSAIQWMNSPSCTTQLVFLTLIHYCIGLFPVDSSIPFLNNWGQMKMAFMINGKSDDVMMMTLLMIKGSFSIGDGSESVTFK